MIQMEFTEGLPGANRRLTNLAKELTGLRKFRRLSKLPRPLKFWEYRKLNNLSAPERARQVEVTLRETTTREVQRRFEALKAELSKNDC